MMTNGTSKFARNLSFFLAASLALGCGKDEAEGGDALVEESGVDVEKNPLGALSQLANVGKEMADKAKKMKEHEPVDPVKFDVLATVLPKPKGWEPSGDLKAETTQMGEFKITTASQGFQQGEGKERQTMKVTVVDGGYVPMVYAPFLMMSKFSREGTDGHSKGLTVEGHPGFEEWKVKSGRLTLTILVADRFVVTIEGRKVDAGLARKWAGEIQLGKLAQWAKDEVTGSPKKAE